MVLPGSGRVPDERIVRQVDVVDEPLTALPDERRYLPGLILGHERDHGPPACGAVGRDVAAGALRTLDELILDRRAPLEDAGEMFDALLAHVRGFRGAHRIG